MKRVMTAAGIAAALTLSAVAFAQPWQGWKGDDGWGMRGGYHGMYDPSKVETVKGEVLAVEQVTPMRRMGQGIALKLKTDTEIRIVHLGPQWYIERQDVKITAGETVEVKGVRAVRKGQDIFIAAEVKKGDGVLKLRDENGAPFWAGWRRQQQQQ